MSEHKVVIILGSKSDLSFATSIGKVLEEYNVNYEYNVASAHKTPEHLLKILKRYETSELNIVYITIAGLSDALSGFVAGFTRYPVVACPPDSEKRGWYKVFSTVVTPKGVAVSFVFEPANAALTAIKILALSNPTLYEKINFFKRLKEEEILKSNLEVKMKKES